MRHKLMDTMADMCRKQQLSWSIHDRFIDNTFDFWGDSDVLTELVYVAGTDFIRIIRRAMGLEAD